MTHLVSDSFDWYNVIADAASGPAPQWDTSVSWAITTGRFTGSQALLNNAASVTFLSKATGSNDGTICFRMAFFQSTSTLSLFLGTSVTLLDGIASQCTVLFRTDGTILLLTGSVTGAILATYSSAFTPSTWYTFEFEVVIHNTAGSIKVLRNGNTNTGALDFSSTSLNTRGGGTGNNFANKVAITSGTGGLGAGTQKFDDFLAWNETGTAPNSFGLGDVRAVQQVPASNSSVQFSAQPVTYTQNGFGFGGASTFSSTLGIIRCNSFAITKDCTLASTTIFFLAAVVGNVKCAVYAADGTSGGPGTLLTTSITITNPSAAANIFTFSSPPLLTNGVTYWVAQWSDVSFSQIFSTQNGITSYTQTLTYTGTFPNPYSGTTTNTTLGMQLTLNALSYAQVSDSQQDGDTSYVQDSNVGHVDQYSVAALSSTPNSIVLAKPFAFARKTDAGARSGQIEVVSTTGGGSTTSDSASTALTTSYGYLTNVYPTDPNTNNPWTAGGVNGIKLGPKVSA